MSKAGSRSTGERCDCHQRKNNSYVKIVTTSDDGQTLYAVEHNHRQWHPEVRGTRQCEVRLHAKQLQLQQQLSHLKSASKFCFRLNRWAGFGRRKKRWIGCRDRNTVSLYVFRSHSPLQYPLMRNRSLNQLCRATYHRHFYESIRKWQKAQSSGSQTKALVSSKRHQDKTCSSTVPALKAQALINSTKGSKCLSQRVRVQKDHGRRMSNRSSRSDIMKQKKADEIRRLFSLKNRLITEGLMKADQCHHNFEWDQFADRLPEVRSVEAHATSSTIM
jgi:hypothetical protein